jgi:hypothetical protein
VLAYLRRHHMGVIALFVALGGTSYAATQLPRNSVGSSQIRNGAVTSSKLANGAVTPAKLSPGLGSVQRRTPTRTNRTPTRANVSWRDTSILAAIRSAGQAIVAQKIVTVGANKPWIATGLTITPGARLWATTRSDGRWSGNPAYFPYSDANGLPVYPSQYKVDAQAPVLSLIGFVGGSPPTPSEVSVRVGARPGGSGGLIDAGLLEVGNTLLNYAPARTGAVWLRNNDNTNAISDVGEQIVKVILTTSGPRS